MHGVITTAFGARRYLEMAVDLALSVRAKSSLPVSVVTDAAGSDFFTARYPALFDRLLVAEPSPDIGRMKLLVASKTAAMKLSPYDVSLFLDADMICLRDPSFLFHGINDSSFRASGRLHQSIETARSVVHHGVRVARFFEAFGLSGYAHCWLAAFVFGRGGGRRVATLMEAEYELWSKRTAPFGDVLNDEILFGLLGGRAHASFFEQPERLMQKQSIAFRWSDAPTFIHLAPMRKREIARVVSEVIRNRRGLSVVWLDALVSRRAEELGRSRRLAGLLKGIAGTWRIQQDRQ